MCLNFTFAKNKINKNHTKIHKFDPSLCCQQDVIAFDITVDGLVDVKVLEALQKKGEVKRFFRATPAVKMVFFHFNYQFFFK